MNCEENRYKVLKSAYEFLNQQISSFESTVELQSAEYNLLREIGRYVDAMKVQLTRYQDGVYFLVNEWKQNEEYQAGIMEQERVFTNDPKWTAMLKTERCVYIKDVEHMQENLKDSYQELKKEAIHSIFVLSVFDDNKLIAIVTICNPDTEKIEGIREIHEILGNWLGYRLIKNDNRIQKILSGLGGDYTAAYMINLDTDYFEVIINQKTNHAAKQKKEPTFEEYVRKYADKYVLEEYREPMKRELNWRNLKEQFITKKEFYFTFETGPNDIGQTCFQAHAVREYGEDGNYAVVGFRCVDEVVRKEREYQKELDKAYQLMKQQLDIITSAIPGGIKISNDDDKYSFKYVSEQYAEMLGYATVEEFMEASGGTIVGIAHPDDLEGGIAEALRQYETADHYAITYRMRCKDGSWKYIEDHGHKVMNSEGKVEHWNLILDKNELVQKTIELECEKKANAAKTAFLSRMSHDIRTPLNGIIGLLEIGGKHPYDLKLITENRKKAMVAANHLLSLINDILELNKLGEDDVVLCKETFNIEKLIQETRTIIWMKAQEDGITIDLEGDYENLKYPYVVGSPLHIQQIFINIITNAIKYNKPGGSVYCHLKEIPCEENQVNYQAIIRDTGIGMSPEFLKTIFQPFTQETQDARSVYQGTGLGMSIVKNLVDRMGGAIEIESEPGVGTAVSISLTFQIGETPKESKKKTMTKDADLTGIRVLLAEDNDLNREIARFILEDEHMIVTEAVNGQDAVELFCENPEDTFDLILMDVMMPVMDGMEAARKIRQLQRKDARSIPIFAMTANAFAEDRQKAKEAGMNEHLSKPLDAAFLLEKIKEYCIEK